MAKKKSTKKSVSKNCNPPGKRADKVYSQNTRLPWFKQGYLMLKANEVNAPLRDFHKQSGYIKKLKLPKQSGNSPVNFLTTSPQILDFFKGGSLDYSQLVPHIEIHKVYISKGNGGIKNMEERTFPFGSLTNWDDMSQSIKKSGRLFRGTEAGIQQVDIKMEGRGRNPVSANVLDIVVKYYFNDVKTLFEPLSVAPLKGNNEQTSYADLIRFPKWNKDYNDFTQRAFRIRLVLGWAMEPQADNFLDQNPGFVGAVLGSKMSIAADLYTHSMEFNENGSLILTAKYKGALETAFGDADILNGAVSPDEKDSTVDEIKQKIRAAEDKFASGGFTKRGRGTQAAFKNILQIERAIEDLAASRKALERATSADQKKAFANVRAALKRLDKAYDKYASGRGENSPLKKLEGAVRKKNISEKSKLERENEAKLAKLRKRYEKAARSKKAKRLKRAITRLRNELKKYQKSIKGKYLFSYVERLQEQNKLAYISTGRGTSFGNYNSLLKALQKYGGSENDGDIQKLAEARAKASRQEGTPLKAFHVGGLLSGRPRLKRRYRGKKKTRKGASGLSLFDSRTLLGDTGILGEELTISESLVPLERLRLEPLSLREQTQDAIDQESRAGAKSSVVTRRRRTEHGDATLWENVKKPKYKKGAKTYFFRLGDLLTVILENGNFGKKLNEQAPNFKLLLGEYDIPQANDQVIRMSLYDLPISLEIFHVFIAQKIVGTGRAVYPFLQFTFDLIKFVMDKTQNVFGKAAEFMDAELLPVSFKMDVTSLDLPADQIKKLTKAKNGATLDVIHLDGKGDKNSAKDLNTLSVDKIKNTSSTFLFHAHKRVSKTGSSIYNGNTQEDEKRGIFHFFVGGPQRGIMKRINFTQANNNLFSMALMRNGQAGGAQSSREGIIQPSKFVCEVTMVGNPFFYIGQMFYVNTDLISGGEFKNNGILNGGYYIVTEVTSNFRSDRWETKIRGVLQIPDHALAKNKNTTEAVQVLQKLEQEELDRYTAQLRAESIPQADRLGAWARRGKKYELVDGNCYEAGTKIRRHIGRCK